MTRTDLLEAVHERLPGVDRSTLATVLDTTLNTIIDTLAEGEEVRLRSFGTLYASERPPQRSGIVDGGTQAAVKVARFRASRNLRQALG